MADRVHAAMGHFAMKSKKMTRILDTPKGVSVDGAEINGSKYYD